MKICEIDSDKIRIGGRTTACKEPLCLVWAGSYVEFNVKASECKILIEGPYETYESWIAIEINGEILSRRMVGKQKEWITLFRMMNKDNSVKVRIIKEVQAFEADAKHRINVYEIETDGELLPVPDKKMNIEFVGDSINSAEGCIGATCEMDWIAQFFSHVNSYPYMVSQMLDADINVISQSGWGVYAAWDCDTAHAVPRYYEGVCSLMPQGFFSENGFHDKWDFTKWKPDAIIINLGTNDDFAFRNEECEKKNELVMDGDSYKEEDRLKVRDAIVAFLKKVRNNNPNARIYWAFGILGESMTPTIHEAMDIYKNETGDEAIGYIALPETKDGEYGSRWHPGRDVHMKAAKAIVEAIKSDFKA